MPFLFKETLIFEGAGHGWTESVYFQQPTDDVDAAFVYIADYRNKRRPLLGAQFHIKAERIALVEDDTGKKVTRIGNIEEFFLPGHPDHPGEDTSTSLEVIWTDPPKRYKKITFLGGVWAEIFPFANAYIKDTKDWTTFFQAWAQSIVSLRLGWRRRDTVSKSPITNHTTNPTTGVTTYTITGGDLLALPLFEPVSVSVEFPNQTSPLDGVQIVIPQTETVGPPATMTLTTAGPRPAAAFTTGGQMRHYTYKFVTPAPATPQGKVGTVLGQKPVSRKRGRPLLVSRGRAPAQIRF